uniref:Carbon starvation protein A n=1 Tax=candidate division WOR-3 bacterium TaxID=2052148 RepID=A0A7C4Y4R6_UNCW3
MNFFILGVIAIFLIAYFTYGKFLEKNYQVKETEDVPSKKLYDGVDFVPTNKFVLLGHHFSSIAGAGPIVGPILAGLVFGWLPAILWIVLGTIFIGGVHDFSSLIISIRHKGASIAEVANKYINKRTYKIFLLFIWLALVYVVAVFTDLTADTFFNEPSVAEISIYYIFIAIIFGILVYRVKLNLAFSTLLSLTLILAGIFFSLKFQFLFLPKTLWIIALLFYCFIASIIPVWFLLQPRDYLSSYFLYFTVIIGLLGLLFGNTSITYPAFISFNSSLGPLFPFLFITIACGAISGFHSLVSSGTTSKQIDSIKNSRFITYGGMILEGIVAAISLSTLMMLKGKGLTNPQEIYAEGISRFASIFHINLEIGKRIGYLAISAFILTTLDTATRISRYIFQEFFGITKSSLLIRSFSTIVSLILPLILLNLKLRDLSGNIVPCWKIIWPLFGTTNQLLAALVLLIIYLWIKKEKYRNKVSVLIPAIFMLIVTISALIYTLYMKINKGLFDVITIIGVILLILSGFIIFETIRYVKEKGYH